MQPLLPRHPNNTIGLIGHHIVNYPSPDIARAAVRIMAEEGVALIELQIPFSEPVADGPVFLAANQVALEQGVDVAQSFALMQEMTSQYSTPMVFMTYVNIIMQYGFKEFVIAAKKAGACGAIIPDLPFDSEPEFWQACRDHDFAAIPVIPPNIASERLEKILKQSTGFVYAVARTGVTGAKTKFGNELIEFLTKIRQHTDLPVAVGFGITSPEDIEFLKPYADYAVVGTHALLTLQEQGIAGLKQFWHDLQRAAV